MRHRKRAINRMFQRISAGMVIAVGLIFVLPPAYTEELSAQGSPEQWEEIALLRFQVAAALELQARNKKIEAIKLESTNSYEAAGDVLDGAGDDKFSASENYQKASKYWQKVAEAYKTAGEETKANEARDSADTTWEAAKRTLSEGAKLHKTAGELYEYDNNLEKKIGALKKVARNLERLLEMK